MAQEECFFQWKFHCEKKEEPLTEAGVQRIENIIRCSQTYGDGVHEQLQDKLDKNHELTIKCHRNCASTYTSSSHLNRFLKRQKKEQDTRPPPAKKTRKATMTSGFVFQEHCLFCGKTCNLQRDPKHPDRWRPAYLCREAISKGGKKSFKDTILEACDVRKDEWAARVRVWVEGAVSDLHAADARYHVDCRATFMSSNSLVSASKSTPLAEEKDAALESLTEHILTDKSHIWNSVELFERYRDFGGNKLSRKHLIKKLSVIFEDDLLVLSSPGIASIIIFRSKASDVLRLVDDEEDDLDAAVTKVSNKIVQDVKAIPMDKANYNTQINSELAIENVSETVLDILANISTKLNKTLPSILIGSIITSVLRNQPTNIQIALGVLIRDSKQLINQMHAFGVTCSYDEILRFKKSAAIAATEEIDLTGISSEQSGLVQVIADNFDADISSQNGKLSTHSLAVLLTQPEEKEAENKIRDTIKRINKNDMSNPIDYEIPIQRYNGPKQPEMPKRAASKTVLPLKVLVHKFLAERRSKESDVAFLQDVLTKSDCPEFNGYNTRISREQGHSYRPRTRAIYLPLIDMIPSDPDTIMTALTQAQHLTLKTGQKYVIFTCDLQLYRVATHVTWAYPDKFENVILRLGGMHSLMSFVGSIGTLMEESGLSEILSDVFGGVSKMLSGKKFPQNLRALRMVAEELLRRILQETPVVCHQDLIQVLEDLSAQSKTTKLWVDVLIKPVLISMLYVRAEREGDWPLHIAAFRQMVPYFFAAGHVHYARYGLHYLRSMESLPDSVLASFMKGEHVMQHVPGLWNGIWSDMFIESTFMRYGHGKGGIIGITLKPETLKVWALSLHICSNVETGLSTMVDGETVHIHDSHKEESSSRILSDAKDREGIKTKLELCIDPLDPKKHPDAIVNIVSGRVGPSTVNVHNSIAIGKTQMEDFEAKWPKGFYDTITKKVVTMAVTKKHVQVGKDKLFNTDLIYSRVIGLQASSRDCDLKNVFSHELAPIPTSMFTEQGEMRISKAKSILKNQLQVEVSARSVRNSESTVIDGSALLWVTHWPIGGTVKDYVNNFRDQIEKRLTSGDVYLVFDRYYEYSIKSQTRCSRKAEASRVHRLTPNTKLPSQKVILTVPENKKQLMDIICQDLIQDKAFHQLHLQSHRLIITGQDHTPVEISCGGVIIQRKDMDTTHEEADIVVVQQMLMIANENCSGITVLSDDTDVFVLLLYYYHKCGLHLHVTMESPIKQRVVVDIGSTVCKYKDIVPQILLAHALSGCDTVACCFGIGKGTVLKTVQSGYSLSSLGQIDAPFIEVMKQATAFMTACYGQTNCENMSQARHKIWAIKTGKGYTSTPKLCTLPPTTEAFQENVKRAHYQACLWLSVEKANPPRLEPEKYGWKRDEVSKTLIPITVPESVALAPEAILNLIRCGCHSNAPCSSARCGCRVANLPCSVFCACDSVGCCSTITA